MLKGKGEAGGCTRDLVHRFYQEKYQINGGQQNRYVTGSDAVGLTMGTYATKQLPIYTYLHKKGSPHYVIADRFFQGANGGSFLNHQWLIAGRAPYVDQTAAVPDRQARPVNTVLDANGMPNDVPAVQTDRSMRRRRRADGTVRRSDAAGELRAGVRQLRGQHGSTLQPAVRRRAARSSR